MHYIVITVVIIALVAFILLNNNKPQESKTVQEEVEKSIEQIDKLQEMEEELELQQLEKQQQEEQQISELEKLIEETDELVKGNPLDLVKVNQNIINVLTIYYENKKQNNQLTQEEEEFNIEELVENLNYISYIYTNTDQFLLNQTDPNGELTEEERLEILTNPEYNQAKNDLILGIQNESIVMWNGIKSELN